MWLPPHQVILTLALSFFLFQPPSSFVLPFDYLDHISLEKLTIQYSFSFFFFLRSNFREVQAKAGHIKSNLMTVNLTLDHNHKNAEDTETSFSNVMKMKIKLVNHTRLKLSFSLQKNVVSYKVQSRNMQPQIVGNTI